MDWAQACGRRLARHGLTRALTGPAEAAAAMCGAHAQVQSAAEVSIGLRVGGVTRSGIRADPGLVKTFGPRGTVHLLAAGDLAHWCGALSAVPAAGQHAEGVRLSAAQTDELVDAIGAILTGVELTVDELTEAIGARVGAWAVEPVMPAFQAMWPRWRVMTQVAAHRGVLCFGAKRGRNVTYTRPPAFDAVSPEAATAWLVRAYLHSFGPATPEHFARWLATTPGWARKAFEAQPLSEVTVGDTRAWVNEGDTAPGEPAAGVLLLPHFDAFVVGSQPRELLFPGAAWSRALAGGQAGNFPVLLIDGVVAGVWHQKLSGRKVAIAVEPLGSLTARHRRLLDEQVDRVGAVLEARPTLTIGPITVGAHA